MTYHHYIHITELMYFYRIIPKLNTRLHNQDFDFEVP